MIEQQDICIVSDVLFVKFAFQGFSCVWNEKESWFKKDFGHSQNLS